MERVRGSELPTITIELRRRSRCGVDRVQMQHSARYNMAIMSLLHVFCTRVFWIEIEGVKAATVEHRAATQPARRPPPGGGRRTRRAQQRAAARGGTSIKQPAPRAARPAPGPPAGAQS